MPRSLAKYADQSTLPLQSFNEHSSVDDVLQLFFDADLVNGDLGTGVAVTFTLPAGYSFDPAAISTIHLSWGRVGSADAEPFIGTFQSSDSDLSPATIPEPSSLILLSAGFAAASFGRRRKRGNHLE